MPTQIKKRNILFLSPCGLALAACGSSVENLKPDEIASSTLSQPAKNNEYTPSLSAAKTFEMTGNPFVDASTQGSYWIPDDRVLTYAVAQGFNGETWANPNYVSQKLGQALEQISIYTDLKFYDVGIFGNPSIAASNCATIVLSLDGEGKFFSNSAWALGHYPNNSSSIYEGQSGDIYFNVNSDLNKLPEAAYEPGGKGFMVLLHELGHVFGLKHPFDNTGGRPTYEEAGYGGYDDQTYTVMSYDDEFGSLLNSDGTFMLGDVLALMWLYGINEETHKGDTSHELNLSDVRSTIWDSSGNDTINLSNNITDTFTRLSYLYSDVNLELEYGYVRIDINSSEHKTHWLIGEFENVIGGLGDDNILGDENNNILNGGMGSDGLDGYGGDDVLYGGHGKDIFRLGPKGGNDVIKDFEVGIDSCIFWDGTTVNDSLATLTNSENGDVMYLLADGSSMTLQDITLAEMGLIA